MAVNGKKKILMISDHALSTSGVGTQSRFLINGLVETGNYTFRQFGAAKKHRTLRDSADWFLFGLGAFVESGNYSTTTT